MENARHLLSGFSFADSGAAKDKELDIAWKKVYSISWEDSLNISILEVL